MTDREPVNIMGVIAFPNPDHDKRMIRFIDSEYHTLFTVKDGEDIVVTDLAGRAMILPCTYIDDYHAKIGSSVFHICEFAEWQEHTGSRYMPREPKPGDTLDTYEIYQIKDVGGVDYCFRSYGEAAGKLRASDYQRAYAGMLAKETSLNRIWVKHNSDYRPCSRSMRAMSVSDVVVLTQGGKKTAYYADTIGFKEVTEFLAQQQKAKNKRKERGDAR